MTWIALRMFLGGAVQKLVQWLSHRSFWQLVCMGLALFAAVQTSHLRAEQRHARKVESQLSKSVAGREADRAAYIKAQADAAALNKVQVAKVEQQQQRITDDAETRYRADLARLRVQSAAPKGSPGSSGAGKASPAPSGPDSQAVPLSGPELLRARETELQLNALIDWVIAQAKVDPNAK